MVQPLLENRLQLLKILKIEFSYDPTISQYIPKRIERRDLKTYLYTHSLGRIIHDSEEFQAIHGPINGRIDS